MQSNKHSRRHATRDAARLPRPSIVDVDPEEPSQLLDDPEQYSYAELDVDAEPHAEAEAELDSAIATTADDYAEPHDTSDLGDVGDLYGVHVPAAADPDLDQTPGRESFVDAKLGEHMFETLEKKLAEGGTRNPEEDVELEDDTDPHGGHHKTDTRDRPVADKGSGGRGGL